MVMNINTVSRARHRATTRLDRVAVVLDRHEGVLAAVCAGMVGVVAVLSALATVVVVSGF